jgi:N-acetylmuramoyl-L-alanine amidase
MIVALAFALQAAAAAPPGTPVKAPVAPARNRPIVVIDAGHGGPDKGMSGPLGYGPKIHEKDITLAVAKRLGKALISRGIDVAYTRTKDTLIDLSDRGRIANNAGGAMFISVHVNGAHPSWRDPAATRGFETYFLSDARTEDAQRVAEMENASVRFEAVPEVSKEDPLSFILSDMKQNEHLRESSELADEIQRSLSLVHPGPNRGVRQAGFRVLLTAFMPAVLVEIGFGTNPAEAAFLSNAAKQDAIAKKIADAAVSYLRAYEKRISGSRP